MEFNNPPGATPLDQNQINGLIPDYLSSQDELNALERANILEATVWAEGKQYPDCLEMSFLLALHRKMLRAVWKWAGKVRTTSSINFGAPPCEIMERLKCLLDDTKFWVDHKTYAWDELGSRFHHRLVTIHPFENGNGRHGRLMTEILLISCGQERFSWGRKTSEDQLEVQGALRSEYIASLQEADRGDYNRLVKFVKS